MANTLLLIDSLIESLLIPNNLRSILNAITEGVGCLDTRHSDSVPSIQQYHLSNATFINEQELEDRLYELPGKTVKFILIPNSDESAKILSKNGYENFIECKLNTKQWEILSNNNNKNIIVNRNKELIKSKYIPLFECCSMIKSNIDFIEQSLIQNNDNFIKFKCCEIGCGSGKDSIYLCLRNKWKADCIDLNDKMLNRVNQFAVNTNVANCINTIKSNIDGHQKEKLTISIFKHIGDEQPYLVKDIGTNDIDTNSEYKEMDNMDINNLYFVKEYDLVISCRFLDRGLIDKLWKKGKMIKTNGFLLIFTFMVGCEKIGCGHPKNPNYLLKHGELEQIFNDQRIWKIVENKFVFCDDGRPMQGFLVQKIANVEDIQ